MLKVYDDYTQSLKTQMGRGTQVAQFGPYTPQQITAIIIKAVLSLLTLTNQMEHELNGNDNPCLRVTKFKESKGRDRILSTEEFSRLFEECKNSKKDAKKWLRSLVNALF